MLTPEQLDMIPDVMDAMFQKLDEFIIRDYARRIAKAGKVTDKAEWLAMRAEEIGLAEEVLQAETAKVLDMTEDELKKLLGDAAKESAFSDADRLKPYGLPVDRITDSLFLSQYIEAAFKQTNGTFQNFGNTMGFVSGGNFMNLTAYYRDRLDYTQLQVSTGVLDYRSAIQQCVKDVSARGVQKIFHESGYRMNVASAARMVTLTGVNQMARLMNDGICDELGLDIVEVTAHEGARPTHREWQGKRFSRSGNNHNYPSLVESTGLGSVDGLCGANCRHNYYGVIEGSSYTWNKEKLENIDPPAFEYKGKQYDYYEATQRMRYMERQIRKTKRESVAYEAAGFESDRTATAIKLRRQKEEYKQFAKAAKIRAKLERTEELGFDF